jgi:hypothetical protein
MECYKMLIYSYIKLFLVFHQFLKFFSLYHYISTLLQPSHQLHVTSDLLPPAGRVDSKCITTSQ